MNVGLIGAGHIARALAEGWHRYGEGAPPALSFYDVMPERAADLAALVHGRTHASATDLVAGADVVVIAVRPQHVRDVQAQIAPVLGSRLLVSVAAGVTVASLRATLPAGSRVARVMPNGAAALGLGVFLLVAGSMSADDQKVLTALLSRAGTVFPLDEGLFDTATAVSGCMPGLLGAIVTHFADAAERGGVPAADARALAVQSVHGAAAVIAREGDPVAVVTATATPGGMTAAGIDALEARGVAQAIAAAVDAAARRAKELA